MVSQVLDSYSVLDDYALPFEDAPAAPLLPYQVRYLLDDSRWKLLEKSRQIGGSIIGTLDVVLDLLATGESWNMMSRSQRQAEKLLNKAKAHVRAINFALEANGLDSVCDADSMGAHVIRFRNGCEIEAVPCDPDTTAGDARNWLLDEFALFPRSHRLFSIIKPSMIHGKRMRVLSTPRGMNHKFHDLVSRARKGGSRWSLHRVTIQDAINDGLRLLSEEGKPMSFEEFQAAEVEDMGFEMFMQEYMCMFSELLHSFLTTALIESCQHPGIQADATPFTLKSAGRSYAGGMDVGRFKDLSVVWVLSKNDNGKYQTELVQAFDRTPFQEQREYVAQLLSTGKFQHFFIDAGGIGANLAEDLERGFGAVVHRFGFTNESKSEIAHRLKTTMQGGKFLMPVDLDILTDFHSIQRDVTDSGKLRIAAPRTGRGHGDFFWAAALALHGAAAYGMRQVAVA